jgi:hypothetical protein
VLRKPLVAVICCPPNAAHGIDQRDLVCLPSFCIRWRPTVPLRVVQPVSMCHPLEIFNPITRSGSLPVDHLQGWIPTFEDPISEE